MNAVYAFAIGLFAGGLWIVVIFLIWAPEPSWVTVTTIDGVVVAECIDFKGDQFACFPAGTMDRQP